MTRYDTLKTLWRMGGLRLVLRAVKARFSNNPGFQLAWNTCTHPVHLRFGTSDIPTFKQVFLDQEYACRFAAPPSVIIDAGANIGLYSILMASQFPAARIIAIEPEKSNFDLLLRNSAPYPNITPVFGALWHTSEDIRLVDPGRGNWGFACAPKREAAAALDCVPGFTVPTLLQRFSLDRVSVLKVDIEGSEKFVFENSGEWISSVDALIVELHDRWYPGCSRSFYSNTPGFSREWVRGENVFLARDKTIFES